MWPTETSGEPDLKEHPAEAFDYYRKNGVERVVCEQKHMGSRAVVVVRKDEGAARARFSVLDEGAGICYMRTGRRFFEDRAMETAFLARIREAVGRAGLWQALDTDWLCLDCELLPWSAKARELLRQQYAAVGAAARSARGETVAMLELAESRGAEVGELLNGYRIRADRVERYVNAYRHYCWPVTSIDDLQLAPFHLRASEGVVHVDKTHLWHMDTLARLCVADADLLLATPYRVMDLGGDASEVAVTAWWHELTWSGGEGMVVKPLDFIARGRRGLLQPAVKCRGRDYLHIYLWTGVYGA